MAALSRMLSLQSSLSQCLLKRWISYGSMISKSFHPLSTINRPFSTINPNTFIRGDIVLLKGSLEKENIGDVVYPKDRPHIIVSSNQVAESTGRILVAPLSTATARNRFEVVLPSDTETGIRKPPKVMANQINTAKLEAVIAKIGTATRYLPQINHGLAMCFGDAKIGEKLEVSRGDVVEIDYGQFIRSGVVVSTDYGNRASRIAMLARSHIRTEGLNEFDLVVSTEAGTPHEKLLVQCYRINTLPQAYMDKNGRVLEKDMERLTAMIYKTLGIKE